MGEHTAFYEEHYSDWTVHALSLTVHVPLKQMGRDVALTLVREILDKAQFDIRVSETAPTRCPGCAHTCCPYPSLECGGDSDVVQACERADEGRCRGCGLPLAWPFSHAKCASLPVVLPPSSADHTPRAEQGGES